MQCTVETTNDGGAAAFCAAARYQTGCDGTPKDLAQALCCYVAAATAGHANARQALSVDFAADEHLESAARLPQVHEAAVRELTASVPDSRRATCASAQNWQQWLAEVERRRFFSEDVALGDRNQQLETLSRCITVDSPAPTVALVWLLVDLIDAHPSPGLAYTGGPALLQYITCEVASPDMRAAACTLLVVLGEREPAVAESNASALWQNTASTLVELLDKDSGGCDAELTAVPALECLMLPCVLPYVHSHKLASILTWTVQRQGRIFAKTCSCICAAVATGNVAMTQALISTDVAQQLFASVDVHCRNVETRQEEDCSRQDALLVTFRALCALLSTGALDGRLACVAESLIGNAIRSSLLVTDHPICHEAFLLLLEAISRPWPVMEPNVIKYVASAVLSIVESPQNGPDTTRRLVTAVRAFVVWLPQSDWDMIPLLVATARSLEKDHANVSACAEWCAIVTPRVKEWTSTQMSAACECVVSRSPTWFARQSNPEAAVAIVLLWAELLKHACTRVEPSGTQTVRYLLSMLDRCGGMQSALKLAADFEQAAHLVAQVARARHYPDLECRQHSSDAAGQYLSLLVEAHITPRLCYTTVGVRSAFEKGDYPQQALLVDTWTSLDSISPPSLVLINAALEQSTVVICQEGLTALPLGVFFRLIWLYQHVNPQSAVDDHFAQTCSRGLQSYDGLSSILWNIPIKLSGEVLPWLFTHMDKQVLSTMFVAWLSSRGLPAQENTKADTCAAVNSVERWIMSSIYPIQFALHLLSDVTRNRDLESSLLNFLLAALEYGSTDSLSELCTHGMRPLIRIIRDCTQTPQTNVAVKSLQLLKRSLNHGLYSVSGHQRRYYSEQLVPLVGAVGDLLSCNLSNNYNETSATQVTSDVQRTISGCIECLFLAVEGVQKPVGSVVAAMRPGADGAIRSQMHLNLYKLLEAASYRDSHEEEELVAVAGSISLFIALLHKDGKYYYHQQSTASSHTNERCHCLLSDTKDLELVNNLLQSLPPTVGALVCTWLGASWQLQREQEHTSATTYSPQRATNLSSAHLEFHMQLLNLVLIGNMSASSLVPISAAYCLEELYTQLDADACEKQGVRALLYGWPSHVARVARDALMFRISCSLEEELVPSTENRAATTEAAELVTSSRSRAPEASEIFSSLGSIEAEAAAARVLGALISRWPAVGSDLFDSTDTAAVLRHVAKQNENNRPAFRSLVFAFVEHGLTAPDEKQEALACVHQIDQYRQSFACDQMSTIAWIPAVQNGLTIPVGRSCRGLCERSVPTLWD